MKLCYTDGVGHKYPNAASGRLHTGLLLASSFGPLY